jgi:hypothetical protein
VLALLAYQADTGGYLPLSSAEPNAEVCHTFVVIYGGRRDVVETEAT